MTKIGCFIIFLSSLSYVNAQTLPTDVESLSARIDSVSASNYARSFIINFDQSKCGQTFLILTTAVEKQRLFTNRYRAAFEFVGVQNISNKDLNLYSAHTNLYSSLVNISQTVVYKCAGRDSDIVDLYNTVAGLKLDIALLYFDKLNR